MTMSEEPRHRLYSRLEDVLGPEEAATLMEHVPPVSASELVTRDVLQKEMALFRSEIRAEFAEFRGEMRQEFAEFRGEIRTMVRDHTRTLLLSLVGLQISAAGLVVAVSHLV